MAIHLAVLMSLVSYFAFVGAQAAQMDVCDFTSFSIVFQLYQHDGRLIMKAVCNGTPSTVEISPLEGIELGPLDQYASA